MNFNHKLFVAVVKRGKSRSLIKSAKKAGLDGATVVYGYGNGIHEKRKLFGLQLSHKKDIILAAYDGNLEDKILSAVVESTELEKPGHGMGFVLHLAQLYGVPHLKNRANQEGAYSVKSANKQFQLIITIVNSGDSDAVVAASSRGGAEGGTVLSGRGTSINESQKFMNFSIDPEKDIILTLVPEQLIEPVLKEINNEIDLDKPAKAFVF